MFYFTTKEQLAHNPAANKFILKKRIVFVMKNKKMKLRYKGLLIGAGVIVLILLFLPMIIKNYAINNSKDLVGRQIQIENVKYNYFTSTLKVHDFKMFEQNEKDVFTSFDTLIVNVEPYRFLFNEKVVEQFYIKGLMVKTVMKDSVFNFDDLITFHNQDTAATVDKNAGTFKYDISNIELKDSNFFFDNQNVGKETHIEDFSFIIPYIGWNQQEKSNADIKFNFKNGGYFQSALNINPVDGEFDAVITINDLYLNSFYEYVLEYAEINDFNGSLDALIEIRGNTNDPVKSIVSGEINVVDFEMTDTTDKKFLGADKIHSSLDKIDYFNSDYRLGTLELTNSYTYFQLDSLSNNFFRIFKLDQDLELAEINETTSEVDTLSNSNLRYGIDKLIVNQGILDYTDNLTGELFNYHLSEISIDSDSITSEANWINIQSDMLLNERGTLDAKLGINPKAYDNLNLDVVIENFLLSDINVYANYYTGHSILLGDFYYYSKSRINSGAISSENQLLVKNVSVENDKSGIYALPLKFALFLLKDKNGDVNLNVPVRGDMNDPEVNIGKLVWSTLKNKITGAASDPIGSIATLVDVNPADYRELVFQYTDTIPNESHFEKLDKLLEMETEKEGLKVQLEHYVDPQLQREAIAVATLGEKYAQDKKKDYLKDKKGFKEYLQKETKNDTVSISSAALVLIDEPTLSALSKRYNEALITNINSYLKSKKPGTNIKAVTTDPKESNHKGSENVFNINFDMLTVMADDMSEESQAN